MAHMWTDTEIDKSTTFVNSGLIFLHAFIENANFEFVVRKHFKEIFLGKKQSLKWLLLIQDGVANLVDSWVVVWTYLSENEGKSID